MKKAICLVIAVGMISTLCSCAANPNKDIVTGKRDGVFETRVLETSPENHNSPETQTMQHTEEFYSTDESVLFRLNIDEEVTAANMPVLEVVPRFITEEEAKNAAQVIFGDVEFFELRPRLVVLFSKNELREMVDRWKQYTDEETIKRLTSSQANVDDEIKFVNSFIEKYSQMIETAPDGDLNTPCRWTYKDESFYWYSPEEASGDYGTDMISAVTEPNGIPYEFNVEKRDRKDYRVSRISVYVYDPLSPGGYDKDMYVDTLLRTEVPTREQIDAAAVKAQKMLDDMNLGEWKVDQVTVSGEELYEIHITAAPIFNGVAAIWRPTQPGYAHNSRYDYTHAEFSFSANGELTGFNMDGLVDVQNVVNDNVAVMRVEELMEKARTYLEHSDYYDYGLSKDLLKGYEKQGREIGCTVDVATLEYNLDRIRMPNENDTYYYIPAITLKGDVCYYMKDTGEEYYTFQDITLVTINGVDGTVVNEINS